ncbi:hypothetical protein GWK36_13560 [Caldichromatium japonicum]|uniref:VWFA domain-containing protein n=2 Tax=Caldichromatium japonicum TaxID=2699430 RepID=A0A6G7VH39_9GAMM|nr:hypothetical protein GWK36_13560 [Caldichromatium japonicum]
MRQTDPRNLRAPAVQLFNELIPAGAIAGVWLFAEQTEVLAPPGAVDDEWRKRLRGRLNRIHSRGLFTDIEGAIRTATADWSQKPAEGERHLILLTDGLTDVSKNPEDSAASRQRILTEQIERLKGMSAKVHAIGLSDQIDEQLMRLLAVQTGGWMEKAETADALQRLFLRVLEQSAPPTTVPIKGNRFEIDNQVRELTVLAFRPEGGQSQLTTPDGERIRADQLLPGVRWRAEAGYDLITIANPKPGQWRIRGVEDPDNRVVIITDLDIETGPLPSAIAQGEGPRAETWLTDHKQPIQRLDLLQVVQAKVQLSPDPAQQQPGATPGQSSTPDTTAAATPAAPPPASEQPLPLDAASARFAADLRTAGLAPGVYRLDFVIDGGTFQRQISRHLKIRGAPLQASYESQLPTDTQPQAAILVKLSADPDAVEPASLFGYLIARGPEGFNEVIEIPKDKRFPLTVKIPIQQPGDYQISGQFIGRALAGEPIQIQPEAGNLHLDFKAPKTTKAGVQGSAEPFSWLWFFVYLLAGNALLGSALGLTWWLMGRARKVHVGSAMV